MNVKPISAANAGFISPLYSVNSKHPPVSKIRDLTGKDKAAVKYWLCNFSSLPASNWANTEVFKLTNPPIEGCSYSNAARTRDGAK
jgi:hypothetical protein